MSAWQYLTVGEVVRLHELVIRHAGGTRGLRDRAPLESAVRQPQQTFDAAPLYPTLAGKAAVLARSLVMGHPFVDGNKRVGHAAMETFLMLNGYEVRASVDEQEDLFLRLASGSVSREELGIWIESHMVALGTYP